MFFFKPSFLNDAVNHWNPLNAERRITIYFYKLYWLHLENTNSGKAVSLQSLLMVTVQANTTYIFFLTTPTQNICVYRHGFQHFSFNINYSSTIHSYFLKTNIVLCHYNPEIARLNNGNAPNIIYTHFKIRADTWDISCPQSCLQQLHAGHSFLSRLIYCLLAVQFHILSSSYPWLMIILCWPL